MAHVELLHSTGVWLWPLAKAKEFSILGGYSNVTQTVRHAETTGIFLTKKGYIMDTALVRLHRDV